MVTLKYWFAHNDSVGSVYENEKGNMIIVFDGVIKVGGPFYVKDMEGNNISPNESGLIDVLKDFIVGQIVINKGEDDV